MPTASTESSDRSDRQWNTINVLQTNLKIAAHLQVISLLNVLLRLCRAEGWIRSIRLSHRQVCEFAHLCGGTQSERFWENFGLLCVVRRSTTFATATQLLCWIADWSAVPVRPSKKPQNSQQKNSYLMIYAERHQCSKPHSAGQQVAQLTAGGCASCRLSQILGRDSG